MTASISPSSAGLAAPVALVTGATAGIGAVFARELARWGYDLVVVARDENRLRALARGMEREFGVQVTVLAADLSTDAGVGRVVAEIERAGAIDVVVNNAGMGSRGTLATANAHEQECMVRLHVLAVSRIIASAIPGMLARRRGALITVSSVASYLTSAGHVNYCATKGYQRIAMEALAREVEGSGVYVQALCPGFTRSEFHARAGVSTNDVPSWLWMSAERVVAVSLAAMRAGRPTVVVPGWRYRLAVALLRHLPALRLRLRRRAN